MLGVAPPNPTLETDSGGRVDALVQRNRTPVAPSPFPSFLAAECRRRNPPPSSIPWRIQAVGSSPLNPCYLPVCLLSPVPPWFAPPFAAAVRRPFRPTPSSTSRWSGGSHVGATSARTGSSRPRPAAPLRPACARGPPRAMRLRVGPPHPRPPRAARVHRAPLRTLAPRCLLPAHGEPSRRQAGPTRGHARWTRPTGSPSLSPRACPWAAFSGWPAHLAWPSRPFLSGRALAA